MTDQEFQGAIQTLRGIPEDNFDNVAVLVQQKYIHNQVRKLLQERYPDYIESRDMADVYNACAAITQTYLGDIIADQEHALKKLLQKEILKPQQEEALEEFLEH